MTTWGNLADACAACGVKDSATLRAHMKRSDDAGLEPAWNNISTGRVPRFQFDLDRATMRVRPELGKSTQERTGRTVPISQRLVAILAGWGRREGYVVESTRTGARERVARDRDMALAWARAGVRTEAWAGRPHHAFRKGFVSGLKREGADSDAVEMLIGHSLGLRGVYTDPDAIPMRAAVALAPPLFTGTATVLQLTARKAST